MLRDESGDISAREPTTCAGPGLSRMTRLNRAARRCAQSFLHDAGQGKRPTWKRSSRAVAWTTSPLAGRGVCHERIAMATPSRAADGACARGPTGQALPGADWPTDHGVQVTDHYHIQGKGVQQGAGNSARRREKPRRLFEKALSTPWWRGLMASIWPVGCAGRAGMASPALGPCPGNAGAAASGGG